MPQHRAQWVGKAFRAALVLSAIAAGVLDARRGPTRRYEWRHPPVAADIQNAVILLRQLVPPSQPVTIVADFLRPEERRAWRQALAPEPVAFALAAEVAGSRAGASRPRRAILVPGRLPPPLSHARSILLPSRRDPADCPRLIRVGP